MFQGARIVLVEDDPIMGASIAQRLEIEGAEVQWVKLMVRALHAIRTPRAPVDAVICDIWLPDGSGEEVFTTLSRTMSPPPFLFLTGDGNIEQAVRMMRAGAADYLTKPFEMQVFLDRLRLLLEPQSKERMPAVLGISPTASKIDLLVARMAADSARPVVVSGPPGTGKAHVARRIHMLSDRVAAPLVEVNLGREPRPVEALFGSGGAVERVGEGTLLLIGIEHLSAELQSHMLRVLEKGFEGRIIATCGRDLEQLQGEGRFRADLISRIGRTEIPIPPLRSRPEDALWLIGEIIARLCVQRRSPEAAALKGLSSLAEEAVRAHDWPDNGREVRNRLSRAVELSQGPWIQPTDLFPEWQTSGPFPTLAEARETAERIQIVTALERTGGQVSEAARLLDVSRTTLWEKMKKLGL